MPGKAGGGASRAATGGGQTFMTGRIVPQSGQKRVSGGQAAPHVGQSEIGADTNNHLAGTGAGGS